MRQGKGLSLEQSRLKPVHSIDFPEEKIIVQDSQNVSMNSQITINAFPHIDAF